MNMRFIMNVCFPNVDTLKVTNKFGIDTFTKRVLVPIK